MMLFGLFDWILLFVCQLCHVNCGSIYLKKAKKLKSTGVRYRKFARKVAQFFQKVAFKVTTTVLS